MHYLFSFTFSFADIHDKDDEEGSSMELCFLLDEAATARTGYTTTNLDCVQPNPFSDWFAEQTEELEEEFNAVHDYSGTGDDHTVVEGFSTYEIETIDRARELMKRWHEGFVSFLGEEGVGPVVEIPQGAVDHTATGYVKKLRDLVQRLGSPTTATPRP